MKKMQGEVERGQGLNPQVFKAFQNLQGHRWQWEKGFLFSLLLWELHFEAEKLGDLLETRTFYGFSIVLSLFRIMTYKNYRPIFSEIHLKYQKLYLGSNFYWLPICFKIINIKDSFKILFRNERGGNSLRCWTEPTHSPLSSPPPPPKCLSNDRIFFFAVKMKVLKV